MRIFYVVNVFPQILWHFFGKSCCVIVILRNPVVDLQR
jgi:hypothetical protein